MRLRDLLLLARAPLAASAAADVVTASLVASTSRGGLDAAGATTLLVVALQACCAYWAGMILNDRFDLERDRALYPKRPLPSGRVPPHVASALGGGLLAASVLLAALAGVTSGRGAGVGLAWGALLAGCVLAYDAGLKRWRAPGVISMAACRLINALGAAHLVTGALDLAYPALLGAHVAALTWISTWEDEDAPPGAVAGAWTLALAVPLALALQAVQGARGPAALLAALPLLAVVFAQGALVVEQGSRRRGEAPTRALLRAVWLVDIAALLGAGHVAAALALAVAFVLVTLAAGALFAPPRPAPAVRHQG